MSPRQDHARVDSGNVPGNPLRSYRLAMLAHGFQPEDASETGEMRPDQSDWMTYSVGPLRRKTSLLPTLLTLVGIVALLAVGALVFG